MPPPSGVAGFRRGGRRAPPPLGCGVCCLGVGVWGLVRGLGLGGKERAAAGGPKGPPQRPLSFPPICL